MALSAGMLIEVRMIKTFFIVLCFLVMASGWLAAFNAMALFHVHSANDALSSIEMLNTLPENESMKETLAVIVKVQQCYIETQPELLLFFIDEWRTATQERIKTFFEKETELYKKLQKDYICKK